MSMEVGPEGTERNSRAQVLTDELLARTLQLASTMENYLGMDENYQMYEYFSNHPHRISQASPFNHWQNNEDDDIPNEDYHANNSGDLMENYGFMAAAEGQSPSERSYDEKEMEDGFGDRFFDEDFGGSHSNSERDGSDGSEDEDELREAQYAINDLPTRIFKLKSKKGSANSQEDSNQRSCCICFDDYKENEMVRTLPCLHFFHKECIDRWLFKSQTCPLCKVDITRNDISVSEI